MALSRYAIGVLSVVAFFPDIAAANSGSGSGVFETIETTEEPIPEGPPKMITSDGSLFTSVPTGKDIHFSIGRDFHLSIGSIPTRIEDALTSSMMYTDTVAEAASVATHASTTTALSGAVSSLDSSISASQSSVVSSLTDTRNLLSNAIEVARISVTNAFIANERATQSAVDTLNVTINANMAEIAAMNACLSERGNQYFNGICYIVSKFQMLKHQMHERNPGRGDPANVDQRDGIHISKSNHSMILWSYSDTFGYQSSTSSTTAVQYEMVFSNSVDVNGGEVQSCWTHSSGLDWQWRIWPTTLDYWTTNPLGSWRPRETKIQLRTRPSGGSRAYMQGWPSNTENAIVATEIDINMMAIRKNMGDRRYNSASWTAVADRSVTYTSKSGAGAAFEVTYTDTHGSYGPSGQQMCGTGLYVNGQFLSGSQYSSHNPNYANRWRINPTQFKWIVPTVTSGVGCRARQACRIEVRAKKLGATSCLYGWTASSMNSLSVIELPAATFGTGGMTKFAVSPSTRGFMNDVRNTAQAWTDIARRQVSNFPVTREHSIVEVMYADTIGIHMISHTWGCGHRVRYTYPGGDGVCGKEQTSHSGNHNGWRIFSQTLKFYCELPAGRTYTFQMQTYRHNGASECLNGWSGSPGIMKVTERP